MLKEKFRRKPKLINTVRTSKYTKKVYTFNKKINKNSEMAQITTFHNNQFKLLTLRDEPNIKFKYLIHLDKWYQEELGKYFNNDYEILDFFF